MTGEVSREATMATTSRADAEGRGLMLFWAGERASNETEVCWRDALADSFADFKAGRR